MSPGDALHPPPRPRAKTDRGTRKGRASQRRAVVRGPLPGEGTPRGTDGPRLPGRGHYAGATPRPGTQETRLFEPLDGPLRLPVSGWASDASRLVLTGPSLERGPEKKKKKKSFETALG